VDSDYWALYRLGRHFSPPLTKRASWKWYLEQAGRTAVAMYRFGGRGTSQWGLMVGSIFALVLTDLRREGMTSLADELDAIKTKRMRKWLSMEFPYGSEFPWDSTGVRPATTAAAHTASRTRATAAAHTAATSRWTRARGAAHAASAATLACMALAPHVRLVSRRSTRRSTRG
jgi:hypothetical protein